MPRPHMPHHLSLNRVKSGGGSYTKQPVDSSNASSVPGSPSGGSRKGSPERNPMEAAGAARPGLPKSPSDKNSSGLVLRVQVLKGRGLAAKDKNGTSDPYLVLTLGDAKQATSVVSKTLNPEWNQSFEFPVVTADSALLEVICWDKDRFKKDYMGEFDVILEDLFNAGSTTPAEKWVKLEGRRGGKKRKKKSDDVTGEVLLKFGLMDKVNPNAPAAQVLQKFFGVVADLPDDDEDEDDEELLAQMQSRDLDDVSEEEDEDDEEKEPSDETDDGTRTPFGTQDEKQKKRRRSKLKRLRKKTKLKAYEFSGMSDVAGVLYLEINKITDLPPEKNSTRTTFDMDPFVVTSLGKKTYRTKVVSHNLNPVYDEKLVFQVQKHEVNYSLNFAVVDRDKFSGNDFVGTATFPVEKIKTLTPEADPETGLYKLPDPETLSEPPAERRKRFRIPLSRSTSQNNLSRSSSSQNLPKLTRTASSNSLNAQSQQAPMRPKLKRGDSENDLLDQAQRPAPTSAPSYESYRGDAKNGNGNGNSVVQQEGDLTAFEVPLDLQNKQRWAGKHHPVLYIQAKYLPYRALRQQFWRAMLKQYDADDSGRIDKVELMTMLDTLGSTLHTSTVDGFFARWKEANQGMTGLTGDEVLTFDQAVISLEEQIEKSVETQGHMHRPHWTQHASQKNTHLSPSVTNSSPDESPGGTTPYLTGADSKLAPPQQQSSSNLSASASATIPALEVSDMSEVEAIPSGAQTPDVHPAARSNLSRADSWGAADSDIELDNADDSIKEEHVVEIQECPICHMPRLDRGRRRKGGRRTGTTDADIITHIATCASSDWRAVNNLVMAGFVTSSQAQRKWWSKAVSKIGYGGYRLGANSANILVQDRITGMINEERMSVYVRLGIRLLYKGMKSNNMEGKRSTSFNSFQRMMNVTSRLSTSAAHAVWQVRKMLRSLSFKQGRKYDDPASASQIPGFINFHQLDMSEVLHPTDTFKTFNEFFYRELKPDARPCSAPDNPHIIVSPADCRSVVFNRMDEAQRIWVKGREFSIERLLGEAYPADAKRYKNGSLGIMRLAPQDYHRFHIPVDGVLGEPKLIEGEYYTVNPMAIRSALDVYGENIRVCVPIDSEQHGRVMVICVGAMMVGSTVITRKKGERVRRAEELGYFKFGGSTLLLLFEPGVMRFDDDLVNNSQGALETLIRVGMSIGHSPNQEPHAPDMQKANPTAAEKQEARRRIEGSMAPAMGKGLDPMTNAH